MKMSQQQSMWHEMLRQSFHPAEWFTGRDDIDVSQLEDSFMWVYRRTESNLYTVGFYAPDGKWNPESDYVNPDQAAERVNFLNGRS